MGKTYRIEYNRRKIELKDEIMKNKDNIINLRMENKRIALLLKKLNNDNITYKQGMGLKKYNSIKNADSHSKVK